MKSRCLSRSPDGAMDWLIRVPLGVAPCATGMHTEATLPFVSFLTPERVRGRELMPVLAVSSGTEIGAPLRPAFAGHVSQIVPLRAEKEVVWSNASGVVAGVADKQPLRDGTVGEFPRDAMCVGGAKVAIGDLAVASPVRVSRPQPTPFANSDSRPEPLSHRATIRSVVLWHGPIYTGKATGEIANSTTDPTP